MLILIKIFILAYLLGSLSIGKMLAKYKNVDLSKVGSGNIGATNVQRALGWKYSLPALLFDIGKGLVPVCIAYSYNVGGWWTITIGAVAVTGHLYPFFGKGRGGKGVATAAGVFIILNFYAIGAAAVIFTVVYLVKEYVSLASMTGALALVIAHIAKIYVIDHQNPWNGQNLPVTILSLIVFLVIIIKHQKNIVRLLNGTENKTIWHKKIKAATQP